MRTEIPRQVCDVGADASGLSTDGTDIDCDTHRSVECPLTKQRESVEYAISVVVPSTRGWPTMSRSVDPILEQLRDVNGQLVVADGSGRDQPPHAKRDDVLWLRIPRGTSYGLRLAGYAAAAAPVVVMTEDHCAS